MGFLGLAPADNLGATYDPAEQVLKLSARGEAPNFTYGYDFKRITWLGGLKFELLAWSGPMLPESGNMNIRRVSVLQISKSSIQMARWSS